MFPTRVVILTSLAMIAFAGNSILCRVALKQTALDPATFTTIRLLSGAITLGLLMQCRQRTSRLGSGNWLSALALFIYAAGFSFAYVNLNVATGALLLFGAVQSTMILFGIWKGERLQIQQFIGLLLALGGLVGLLLPGLSAPPVTGSAMMISAGIAWGIYSLRGKGAGDPTQVTAGNFLRTIPFTALLTILLFNSASWDAAGVACALTSGALTSGVGYAIWYSALPTLKATTAATVQLSVPVLASLGGVIFLGEPLTLRLTLATITILGGIALLTLSKQSSKGAQQLAPVASIPPEERV